MRRSARRGSDTTPQEHRLSLYSENSDSSDSVPSRDSSGHWFPGQGPGEPEGRRDRVSSCRELALRPRLPRGSPRAGSSRQEAAPGNHNLETACGAATVRGGASGAGGVEPVALREGAGPALRSGARVELVEIWSRCVPRGRR